ncbi:MAG TPA: DUF2274 domain-containing protein [Candidatus Binataceae bacterium]|nr:DUF2274 domain-containing protein [Candidatus Binataceae bacterium]
MELRLKDKELRPTQLRLTLPGNLKALLDEYLVCLRGTSHREAEIKEIALEMLRQFVETDRDFRMWRKQRAGTEVSGVQSGVVGERQNVAVGAKIS